LAARRRGAQQPGPDQAQRCAEELVALRPDILVGNSTPATAALLFDRLGLEVGTGFRDTNP
jgi:hypothetical protein